ncbi:G-protein alpha subunit [Laetiporus sulphureus 93-53]|uniref:G-protein alpha subunit n=1 Tax=Laetiporus sulphureus 93-53 TaxID=1314785 RepID=A0A165CQW6_9APHY|nr:G-protein alpha subunit [Laetiporus sulphureus 93-53]KZT03259.1 G-protein alpha subunit [Laetiporus sulphureus 93-53]
MGQAHDVDPLAAAIAPPPDETPAAREARLQAEAEAKRISESIDEQLKTEKAALKKKKPIKVLLLGQSESGKSTTLKNFQLTYSPKAWAEERESWRTVIQLNLVRNMNTILDLLAEEMTAATQLHVSSASDSSDDEEAPIAPPSRSDGPLRFTDQHALLKLRLAPLHGLQKDLEARLGIASHEEKENIAADGYYLGRWGIHVSRPQEAFIRSHHAWKSQVMAPLTGSSQRYREMKAREATEIIAGCAEDMRAIWEDSIIQQMLRKRKLRMEATSGFFLNDVERIAARDYEPSDDDVVRARLRTLGVQEYKIKFEKGPAAGSEWCLYDVGGSRTQRAAWFPYFDDCDAIIFLAPVNCFDERLAEDRKVNRLEDSYLWWKLVCSSKLLARTEIILFLNKCDLLDQKLQSGVLVKEHVRSFGDRPNDVDTVSKYFALHFKDIMKRNSLQTRQFRVYYTSVIDTKATAVTLSIVEEAILRAHLVAADLA